jgi:signal transduction histidine kinase
VYSHYTLPNWAVSILDLIINLILHRVRSGDDIAANRLTLSDKARWEATLMYVHRLAHDVRKPIYQAQLSLDQLLNDNRPLPSHAVITLERLRAQLTDLRDLISTRAGTSIEEMRAQAIQDAHIDQLSQLIEDAVWVWELDAERRDKEIFTEVKPSPDELVKIPRFLVVEVLGNLVSNAVRFARKRIWVTAEHHKSANAPKVTFTIRDDGKGLSKTREKTSVPYHTTQMTQSGLGLHISRFIVEELLCGELYIKSSPRGVSATFSIPEVI